MKKTDRVALTDHPEFVGTIAEEKRGVFEVLFDGGGVGRFKADALTPADEATVTTKTWPPAGLETKSVP